MSGVATNEIYVCHFRDEIFVIFIELALYFIQF